MRERSVRKSGWPPGVVVALLVCGGLWAGCERSNALEGKLEQAIRTASGNRQPLKMEDVTDFAWSELHIFGPYSAADEMHKQLGFVWLDARDVQLDSENLLVFVHERKVVKSLHFPRAKGDFILPPVARFLRAEARFVVQEPRNGSPSLVLVPESIAQQSRKDGGTP
ncbi:hypothetical protein [Hyalangium gracile]|uniref:hypothetical protein n=1 Tax=Hyalangium gracile TaxID=394092 RepID=UPI001CC9BBDB|nr:hypothetical protein [Hyalangium gracile]